MLTQTIRRIGLCIDFTRQDEDKRDKLLLHEGENRMAERSILAYFNTPDQAKNALKQLKQLQLVDAKIDRFNGVPNDGPDFNGPETNDIPTTGAAMADVPTMGPAVGGNDLGPPGRDAGDVTVTLGVNEEPGGVAPGWSDGRDILLTAIVQEEDFDKAMSIVHQAGAL
jgi:hypothetical protein